jgi:molybdopterin-containing oxidoreductase family membrane subunit
MIDKDFHPERTKNETFTQDEYMEMKADLLKPIQHIGLWGKVWIGFLIAVIFAGVYAYYLQETKSKYVTVSLRDYTMWGVYISNFVFFIALSMIGVLMSAVLKLTNNEWYRPLSRIAEVVALGAICFAGISIVVAMGRPDRLHYLFMYPRLQSPITWDIIVVITYVVASMVLLYIPMIPSLSTCRNHLSNMPKWQMKMYEWLSFGWEGNPEQWKLLRKGVKILTIMIIPLGVAIQTVDAWLFATTLRPEWDSTNFSGYFISGAFLLGTAAMIVATFVIRKAYNLEKYLTEMHFDKLGQAMVLMSSIYIFFNINEYLVPAYKMSSMHANHLIDMFIGEGALMYWMVVLFGLFIPAILPLFPSLRKPLPLFVIALIAVIAHWFKRYLIVIPGQLHPYLPIQDVPESWTHYTPSSVELTIVAATFAGMLLIVTLFSRFFPIISVWEVAEGKLEGKDEIINYK